MKAYIAVSFNKRKLIDEELAAMVHALIELSIASFIFVDNYSFDATQEQEMMQQALRDIDNCDFLIAETSDKGIGIGIEVGYAKAKGKPIIYVRKKEAEHSTTVSGISDFHIIYDSTSDLKKQLTAIAKEIQITLTNN